jgi:hypothetical protein
MEGIETIRERTHARRRSMAAETTPTAAERFPAAPVLSLSIAKGRKFEFPTTMNGEKIEKLGVLVSQVDRPVQPPLPRYATDIMPPGLTEDKALQ